MSKIHKTAIIEDGAQLGTDVEIGAYSVVGPHVVLGDGVRLESHVVVSGHTQIGAGTHIFPFASIGHQPQDLKFSGETTRLEIGSDNIIREHVTMNPGTSGGGGITRIGNHGLFMVGVHIAHDCQLGNHIIMANNAAIAGHVEVGDYAGFGGYAAVHQFCRVGAYAFLGGGSIIVKDIIPYGLVMGNRAYLAGLNLVGLKRNNFSRAHIQALSEAYKLIFFDGAAGSIQQQMAKAAKKYGDSPLVDNLLAFMAAGRGRGYCMPQRNGADIDEQINKKID